MHEKKKSEQEKRKRRTKKEEFESTKLWNVKPSPGGSLPLGYGFEKCMEPCRTTLLYSRIKS